MGTKHVKISDPKYSFLQLALRTLATYNKCMDSILPFEENLSKRMIADALRRIGTTEITNFALNKRQTYYDALATMIWQGIVEGIVYFADGTTFAIPDLRDGPKLWMDMVRFIAGHLDGGVGINAQFNTQNVFKIYQGIDPERV